MKLYSDVKLKDVSPVAFTDINYNNMEAWHKAIDATIEGATFWFDRKLTTKMKEFIYGGDKSTPDGEKFQVRVADIPMGFDIETTSVVDKDVKGKVIGARAYMYYGCVGIGETIVHCRTWEQVMDVFGYFSKKGNFGIENAHRNMDGNMKTCRIARVLDANLGFEFFFMWKKLKWQDGFKFAMGKHDVIYALSESGLLFQDPLKISNSSLEDLAKMYHLPTQKTHDLDYTVPRNSKTPLKPEEKNYVSCDVRILLDFARWCHINYTKNGLRIPLTQTAMLRDTIKKYYEDYRKKDFEFTHSILPNLFPSNPVSYEKTTLKLFRGGYTHANIEAAGSIFYADDDVNSWDIDSSYVYSMICQKFPMGEWKPADASKMTVETVQKLAHSTAFMMKIKFRGLISLHSLSLESITKTEEYEKAGKDYKEYKKRAGAVIDNGRIRYANECTVWLTELDLLNYCDYYAWDSIEFIACFYAPLDYLPDYVRIPVMNNYLKKSYLKSNGMRGTTEYAVAKAGVNAAFGLMVEKMKMEDLLLSDEGEFISDRPDDSEVNTKEKKKLYFARASEIYHDKVYRTNNKGENLARNPLSPYWGVWVSAHARRNLLKVVHMIGDDHLYCDTDSVYCKKSSMYYNVIAKYNDIVKDTTRIVLSKWNSEHPDAQFDFEMFKNLGTFGVESVDEYGCPISYSRFLTLGAKKYLKENYKGDIEQVLAGLPKGAVVAEAKRRGVDAFSIFRNDLKIANIKKCCTYNKQPTADCITDTYGNSEIMSEDSSVAIYNVDFSLKLNSDFVSLMLGVLKDKERKDYLAPVRSVIDD